MISIRSFGLSGLWTSILVLCPSVLVGSAFAQDASRAEDGTCGPREITPECSEGTYLNINGDTLYYEVHGQGEPLLLMHGGAGSAEHFNPMLPALAKHFRVITPDSPHGVRSSIDPDVPLSYHRFAETMIALLDSLGIESAYVGGWSDGAIIAVDMAVHHPERVRALLAMAANFWPEATTEEFRKSLEEWGTPENVKTLWLTQPNFSDADAARIRMPTLILVGEDEPFIDRAHFEWQHRAISGSELVWIPDADHFLVIEKPDEVSQALLSFLQRHR